MFVRDNHSSRAVGDSRRIARSHRPGFREHRRQFAQLFHARIRERMLVTANDGRAFLAFDGDRDKFGVKSSRGNCTRGAGLRHQSIFILLFARDFIMLGQHFGGFSHHHLRHGTEKPVAVHAVDHFLIAQPESPARLEIIRNPRHGFRSARQNATRIPEQNRLISQSNRLQPRGARFVHRERRNFLRHAAANGNLPRRIRAAAGLSRVAEDRFFHLLRPDSSALDRSFGGHRAHISRRQRSQRPSELPNRRPHCGEYVDSLQSVASKTFESSRAGKDARRRGEDLAFVHFVTGVGSGRLHVFQAPHQRRDRGSFLVDAEQPQTLLGAVTSQSHL